MGDRPNGRSEHEDDMPKNLTDSTTWASAVQVPVGGDARKASSLEPGYQALADRTAYLRQLAETLGIKTVRSVASTAALQALSVPTDAIQIALVYDDDAFGLYVWLPGSTAPLIPGFVEPTTTLVVGRWLSLMSFLVTLGGVSGAAKRLSTEVLPVPNRVVSLINKYETSPSSLLLVGQTAYTDFGFNSDPVVLQAGDQVKVCCNFSFYSSLPSSCRARIAVDNGSTTAGLGGTDYYLNVPSSEGGYVMPTHLVGLHTIETPGTYRYKLQGRSPGDTTIGATETRQFLIEVIRP
jgi:hypothetical protein